MGWCGVAAVCGAFFDLPLSTTALIGALLGPIGFVVVILLGIVGRTKDRSFSVDYPHRDTNSAVDDIFL